jgi:hypothetical protein
VTPERPSVILHDRWCNIGWQISESQLPDRMGGGLEVPLRRIVLLALSSLLNAVICVGSFLFGAFATNPEMQDVTMRIGYYVLNGIVVAAFFGTFGPWILVLRQQHKSALFLAILPTLLACIAILSFLTLDSWLQRTFSS